MRSEIYNDKIKQIYGGDPRELPLYGITETSRYLKINKKTLLSWIDGRNYKLDDGTVKWWSPVIRLPDPDKRLLSFYNLVEIHVLSAIRRVHNVQFRKVRLALKYLEAQAHDRKHPLATIDFWTDNFDLFVEESGGLICASQHGQYIIREAVAQYLHRIDKDIDLSPFRLYPFSREITFEAKNIDQSPRELEALPKNIVIDPLISFGRPTIAGTGVPTNVIAGRFKGGDSIKALVRDYEIEEAQIQEALQYEGVTDKAA